MSEAGTAESRLPPTSAAVSAAPLTIAERVQLIRGGLLNYSGVLVAGIVGIAVVPTMLSRLGAPAYGLWVAVLALVAIVAEVDCGLSAIVTRAVAAAPHSKDKAITRLVTTSAVAYLVLAVIGGALVASLGGVIDADLTLSQNGGESIPFVFAMGGVLSVAGRPLAFSIALLYGWQRFGLANALVGAVAVLSGAGTVAILLGGGGLAEVAAWQAASTSLVAAVALVAVTRLWHVASLRIDRPSWRSLRPHLRFGLASQILTGGVNLLWVAAPVLVGSILGSRLVAAYDVGRKFPLAVSTVSWRSSEAFFPAASRESRAGNIQRRRDVLDAITRWNLVLVLPFSIVLWVLAPNLLEVWLGTPPAHSTTILRLLAAAVVADAFGVGPLHVLWAEGRMRPLLGILAATTLVGLGLTATLLWQVGVVGVAIGLATTMTFRSLLLLRAVIQEHRLSLLTLLAGAVRGIIVPLAACAFLSLALREVIGPRTWIGLTFVGVVALLGYLLAISFGRGRKEEQAILAAAVQLPQRGADAVYRRLRAALRRVGPLRSAWYLMHELARMAGPEARPTASRLDREFATKVDPWDYRREAEQERHQAAIRILDAARAGRLFTKAVEIGCAEGMFTELLVPRCEKLVAVDISSVALARARERLARRDMVRFEHWDVLRDADLGSFDLVVAMDVLDYFVRPGDFRRVQARIRQMLVPGGHLLVTTPKQSEVVETAWWRRRLPRGRMINESLASLHGLRVLQRQATTTHLVTLYARTDV